MDLADEGAVGLAQVRQLLVAGEPAQVIEVAGGVGSGDVREQLTVGGAEEPAGGLRAPDIDVVHRQVIRQFGPPGVPGSTRA